MVCAQQFPAALPVVLVLSNTTLLEYHVCKGPRTLGITTGSVGAGSVETTFQSLVRSQAALSQSTACACLSNLSEFRVTLQSELGEVRES